MSHLINPNFFRKIFLEKSKKLSSTNKIVDEITNNTSISFIHKKKIFKQLLLSFYTQNTKRDPFYLSDPIFQNNANSLSFSVGVLLCIKSPEFAHVRKRISKKVSIKREQSTRLILKKLHKVLFLFSSKNLWTIARNIFIFPLLNSQNRIVLKSMFLVDKQMLATQSRVFRSLRKFSREKFFDEGFCLLNWLALGNTHDLSCFVEYICRYFKRYKNHKRFYNFLKMLCLKYSQYNIGMLSRIMVQIQGRFFKNKRSMKRKFFFGRFPLNFIKFNCYYNENFTVTKTGTFGVKVWIVNK